MKKVLIIVRTFFYFCLMIDLGLYSGFLLFLDISGGELLIIIIAIFVVFGPQKIPELARKVGKGLGEIKHATNKIKAEISEEVKDITDSVKEVSDTVKKTTDMRKNVKDKYNEKVKETPQPEVDPYEELEEERQKEKAERQKSKKSEDPNLSGEDDKRKKVEEDPIKEDKDKDQDTIKNN